KKRGLGDLWLRQSERGQKGGTNIDKGSPREVGMTSSQEDLRRAPWLPSIG
ncbi:MAG: hypothetical protein ACI835_003643, partial [Planctomycetota bacterium]